MCYKLMVKIDGRWQAKGFNHMSVREARNVARQEWGNFAFVIVAE